VLLPLPGLRLSRSSWRSSGLGPTERRIASSQSPATKVRSLLIPHSDLGGHGRHRHHSVAKAFRNELCFSKRSAPLKREIVDDQQSIVPEAAERLRYEDGPLRRQNPIEANASPCCSSSASGAYRDRTGDPGARKRRLRIRQASPESRDAERDVGVTGRTYSPVSRRDTALRGLVHPRKGCGMSEHHDQNHRVEAIADARRDMEQELRGGSRIYTRMVQEMAEIYGEGELGGLDQQQRILIALGMAVHGGAKSAVEWTITRALNHGVSEEAIRGTIDIALLNGGTFAVSNARFGYETLLVRASHARGTKNDLLSVGDVFENR
jgi:alkylhydroperoxidase/carboxymuconolactone decarboxylase family protein YurZ